jgi:hypothetical protein
MAVNNMKKKAQDGKAVSSNKFTITTKQAPDKLGKKVSEAVKQVPDTIGKKRIDSTAKSFESNKFTIPKKTMKSGGKMKKK